MMVGFCERMTGEVRIAQHVQVLRNCGKGRHSCLIMKDKSRWCQFYGLLGKDIVQAILSLSLFSASPFFRFITFRINYYWHGVGVLNVRSIVDIAVTSVGA